MRQPTPRTDIALAAFLIAVCAVVLWQSLKIPPGTFEPLGSAPVPQAVACLIIVLCIVVIVRALPQLTINTAAAGADAPIPRTLDTVIVAVLTLLYAAILHSRVFGFAPLTTLYLILTIGLLTRFKPRLLPAVIGVAAAMGYGCQYLFTQVFVVDLPGAF